jgi:hypothetical protein
MSEREFRRSLARNGFEPDLLPGWFRDATGQSTSSFGGVFFEVWKRGERDLVFARRATIAHLLRARARSVARSEANEKKRTPTKVVGNNEGGL